ncbi:MAG TPA: hypothetical protein VEG64_02725 [Candidatus Sulfotelmatobacter sp.]|nr:hypothetical protein [Candidatus Sulfotelmatobacter sp.]
MAALTFSGEARAQFGAIARVRWRLFVNSLRTIRGRLELVSRIFLGTWFALLGIGGAVGLAVVAGHFVSDGKPEWLAALLWPVFGFWQLFPVLATVFTENFDSSNLLRFPLSYPSFFLIRLVYGSLDPATFLGLLWTTAIGLGLGIAAPPLLFWAAIVLIAFAGLNILLGRMVFAWLERWLAQRRTREILGVLFFLIVIGFQFTGPVASHWGRGALPHSRQIAEQFLPLERLIPPGVAAQSISLAWRGEFLPAVGAMILLGGYALAALWLLHVRLHAQYRGESLSETPARAPTAKGRAAVAPGWNVPGLSGPITAVLEKELRYLSHSTAMLLPMVMPVVVLVIFRFTPGTTGRNAGLLSRAPDLAFPAGAAYALLILSNLVYNNFGADGTGVQFYFASPVKFRDILLAKNLAHTAVLAMEICLVWLAVCYLFAPPSLAIAAATLAGVLFALLVNIVAGNVLSLYSPKKVDYGTLGRQRGSQASVFASLGVQVAVFTLAFLTLYLARAYGKVWLATLIFLLLAAAAFAGYALLLSRADEMALSRREILTAELSRT